jgi:Tol biopolymer transport system component
MGGGKCSVCGNRVAATILLCLLLGAVTLGSAPRGESAHPGGNGMLSFFAMKPGGNPARELFTVNPDGTGTALFATEALTAEWSPDGSKMLFQRVPGGGVVDIHVVNVDGTGERKLTSGIAALSPSWSPDGSKIAYKHASTGNAADGEIWVMNADGTGKTQITADGYGKLNLDWGMTPAGPKIAYFGFRPSVSWSLVTINPDGSGLTRMTGVSEALASHSSSYAPDWSPDGAKIVFSSYLNSVSGASLGCNVNVTPYDVFVYDTATNLLENLTSTPAWQGPHEASPVWSPDGTRIAAEVTYWTCVNGSSDYVRPPIYTMPATGGQLVKVTSPPSDGALHTSHFRPQWQPCVAATPNCTSVTPPPPTRLVSITVTPSNAAVQVGSSRLFTATGGYSDGSTADLTGSATWGSTNTAVATVSGGGLAHGVGGGVTTVTATLGEVGGSASLSVTKRAQTIVFAPLPNRRLGGADFALRATASSGLAVIFSAAGRCTVRSAKVHLTGAGTCTIRASQHGNAVYDAASPVQRTFSITAGPTCRVPRVVGLRLAAAKRAIVARRCRTGVVRRAFSRTFKKGVVMSQSRRAGKVVPAGTKINLVVSR